MSQATHELLAVYIDGETKTGKGAASQAIAEALSQTGLNVYYDVAGDFFRRYVALVRQEMNLGEDEVLPRGPDLEQAAQRIYDERRVPFARSDTFRDLQRPTISRSVSVFGELAIAQRAGGEWYVMAVRDAQESRAGVIVLDGRNPRRRVVEQAANISGAVRTVLDLYLTCEASEAARRVLLAEGISEPGTEQLEAAHEGVLRRRAQDSQRKERPFLMPTMSETFDIGSSSVDDVLNRSWQPRADAELPITITLDNTHISKLDMLAAVTELAVEAVEFAGSTRPPI